MTEKERSVRQCPHLNLGPKLVYLYLMSIADEDDVARATQKNIAHEIGISYSGTVKMIKSLSKCGYISVRRYNSIHHPNFNEYILKGVNWVSREYAPPLRKRVKKDGTEEYWILD